MTEIIPNSLETLAVEIRAEHKRCQEAMRESLTHALRVGELLNQAKELIPHGEWLPWLAANCEFSERTARGYMSVARNWEELSKSATVADLTYREALQLLAAENKTPQTESAEHDSPLIRQFKIVSKDWAEQLEQSDSLEEILVIEEQAAWWANRLTAERLRHERKLGQLLNDPGLIDTVKALREIRDGNLFGDEHPDFDAYCLSRWGVSGMGKTLSVFDNLI